MVIKKVLLTLLSVKSSVIYGLTFCQIQESHNIEPGMVFQLL